MNKLNRFNGLARHYDLLANLVFGKVIRNCQHHFLGATTPAGKILILGGGTGELLTRLQTGNQPSAIWYVEASSEMLARAEKRVSGPFKTRIHFIHGTEESLPEGMAFDAIITHFLLDLFPEEQLLQLCNRLRARLSPDGIWLVSDFVQGKKWWQNALLWMMYRFFVGVCEIPASTLPRWEEQLKKAGMVEMSSQLFFSRFIKSAVYRGVEHPLRAE